MSSRSASDRRLGFAWLAFAASLALHVADEATHDFLSVYNPNAVALRQRGHLPVPVFTFREWITALSIAVALLFCLSVFAFRGARWLRIVATPLAIIIGVMNASAHIIGSLYYGRFMPGVYSSPVLLAAAIALLASARTHGPKAASTTAGW